MATRRPAGRCRRRRPSARSGRGPTSAIAPCGGRLDVAAPADAAGLWITRADALPEIVGGSPDRRSCGRPASDLGSASRRAACGSHGCADALGDTEPPAIELCWPGSPALAPSDARRCARAWRARDLRRRGTAARRSRRAVALFLDVGLRCFAARSSGGRRLLSDGTAAGPGHTRTRGREALGEPRSRRRLARLRLVVSRRIGVTATADSRSRFRFRGAWSRLRLRQTSHLRDLSSETTFTAAHFIQPIFVVDGLSGTRTDPRPRRQRAARAWPRALDVIARDLDHGVRHFLLFHVPDAKSGAALRLGAARACRRGDQVAVRRRAAPVGRHLPVRVDDATATARSTTTAAGSI